MKKLMFAAVAAAAGGLMAIESANVVGYQDKSVELDGMFMMGSGFLTVGTSTDSYSIQSLIPQYPADAEDPLGDGEAQIQEVGTGGEIGTVYMYLTASCSYPGFDGAGWYTQEGSTFVKATRTFSAGEGFLYAAPYAYKMDGDDEEQLSTYLTFQE